MNSIKDLVNMVLTEAIEGEPIDHFFDESKIPLPVRGEPKQDLRSKPYLPPIKYNLKLIKNPNGSYEWVE